MSTARRSTRTIAIILVSAGSLAGCWPINSFDDCELNPALVCYWTRLGYSLTAINGGAGGGGGSTPVACVPSESGAPVGDGCGVFVATSGSDKNTGTRASPVATLSKAVELAAKKNGRVYACDETFNEALVINSNVELYGGLDCANAWAYVGDTKKTTLSASTDAIPLVMMSSASGSSIVDFAVHVVDVVKEGASSIAVIADGATAEFVRCEISAGNGAAGAVGAPGDPNGTSATAGAAGNSGKAACSDLDGTPGPDTTLSGGAQVTNDCGGDLSVGGPGGAGHVFNGSSGSSGQTGTKGQAGQGESPMGAWDCVFGSGAGNPGAYGEVGMPGTGAMGLGAINASGYAGTSGGAGTSGKAGQGGGGGGGAKGGVICPGAVSGSGASGGSGGAGGCGGLPGTGGGAGGASIALVSLNASITLTDSTLLTSKGGEGGPGGDLQPGGSGGDPGKGGKGVGGANDACSGGQGGKGGNGGPGGGGFGGPSIGVAFTGSPVTKQGKTTITPGSPGAGGKGGSANVAMNAGAVGAVGEEQLFPE